MSYPPIDWQQMCEESLSRSRARRYLVKRQRHIRRRDAVITVLAIAALYGCVVLIVLWLSRPL